MSDPLRDTALCTLSSSILNMGVTDKALGVLFPSLSGQAARLPAQVQGMAPLPSPFATFSPSPAEMQKFPGEPILTLLPSDLHAAQTPPAHTFPARNMVWRAVPSFKGHKSK